MANVDQSGIVTLKQLGVSRIIDLRSQKEINAEPDPLGSEDGFELIAISLFDDLDPHQLPQGNVLLDLYIHALETQGSVFVDVLRNIADCPGGALFHCTAGKDRAGLIAALLLSLSGVSNDDVIQDYALTADRLGPLLQTNEKTAQAFNVSKADYMLMLECNPSTMIKTLEWLVRGFNGAEGYVRSHGFTYSDLQQLKARWNQTDPLKLNADLH